jgi:hypothetical protein
MLMLALFFSLLLLCVCYPNSIAPHGKVSAAGGCVEAPAFYGSASRVPEKEARWKLTMAILWSFS